MLQECDKCDNSLSLFFHPMLRCLFVNKVDSKKESIMKEKYYYQAKERILRNREIYRLHAVDGMRSTAIAEKVGISLTGVYRAFAIFERENPLEVEAMKKQGKSVTPEDYQKLLEEISSLKKDLSQERLRADFYEEMVAFGKEVYGIDLKKAGTK